MENLEEEKGIKNNMLINNIARANIANLPI
jgi:hypothetical protein